MFSFSSFKKVLLGVTFANVSVIGSCFYIFKKNRPLNDETLEVPNENFRIRIFDTLAKEYDEKNDFIEKITSINKYRRKNFRKVRGIVLEIGAGSGRNISYLKNVDVLVCVEKSEEMCKVLKNKVDKIKPPFSVYIINDDIKNKIFKPNVFDNVISSFTLCSLEYVNESLQNIYNLLKSNGKFYLIERGIIYHKTLRYILEKLKLYPNKKIPWEYGYYENRYPIDILKNNNFSLIFKLIKNAGTIYVLIAKKNRYSNNNNNNNNNNSNITLNDPNIIKENINISINNNQHVNKNHQDNLQQTQNINTILKDSKNNFDIHDILYKPNMVTNIYHSYIYEKKINKK
ncbi:methyltransferase, putative [Plasmodium gaboni]|uniref:Methyltransferase, putative n=1 Tax=Plasmodium gaboni TaxID=647221 RepID=A0ABY1UHX1_9APIC|nr:methyltransferase, putative [Plasmodium gaboni]